MRMFGFEMKRDPRRRCPYKVGLALSGGGARGFAHAGAIEAMLEVGLRPDIVCGVSAGSVVAVMHAAGIPPHEMVEMFASLKFNDLCSLTFSKGGFFTIDKFRKFLRDNIPYRRLEQLPIPTVVCATDFDKGKKVAFTKGDIAECVTASCCIPIVFRPVVIGSTRYVDGGVLANLPAWAIRDKCRFLVGINCSPMGFGDPEKDSVVSNAIRSYTLVTKHNAVQDMDPCDMLISTDAIARYKVFDLSRIETVYKSGYRSTMQYFRARGISPKKSEPADNPAIVVK